MPLSHRAEVFNAMVSLRHNGNIDTMYKDNMSALSYYEAFVV